MCRPHWCKPTLKVAQNHMCICWLLLSLLYSTLLTLHVNKTAAHFKETLQNTNGNPQFASRVSWPLALKCPSICWRCRLPWSWQSNIQDKKWPYLISLIYLGPWNGGSWVSKTATNPSPQLPPPVLPLGSRSIPRPDRMYIPPVCFGSAPGSNPDVGIQVESWRDAGTTLTVTFWCKLI